MSCCEALSGAWAGQPLASVTSMPAAPWPHQLVPALALVQGHSTRMLVADAVGLGKTLTAAVVLSELTARGVGSRVLILVPAGLRDQWRDELLSRAGIVADIVDAAALATRRDGALTRPSPWAGPGVSIVSLDFAKQPTVLAGLLASPWDLLILDEAHMASGESARAAAVSRIAAISRVVVAITATPHSGDTRAFHWLLGLGGGTAPMLWFRREPRQVGLAVVRRTRSWRIRPSPGEDADARRAGTLRAPRGTAGRRRRPPGDDRASQASAVERRRAGMQPAPAPCAARRRSVRADPSPIRAQPWRSGHRRLRRREAAGGARVGRSSERVELARRPDRAGARGRGILVEVDARRTSSSVHARASSDLHRVSRHARSARAPARRPGTVRRLARRHAARRASGRRRPIHARRRARARGDGRRGRRAEPAGALPARREPRAAVVAVEARAARRSRRSHRPVAACPRLDADRRIRSRGHGRLRACTTRRSDSKRTRTRRTRPHPSHPSHLSHLSQAP